MICNMIKNHDLNTKEKRNNTVLVFGGTGINFWIYLPLFNFVKIEEIADFAAIYTISGGSGPVWLHCHKEEGSFHYPLLAKFDFLFRKIMNQTSLFSRIQSAALNSYIYKAESLRQLMSVYLTQEAAAKNFSDFALKNFHVVAYDVAKNDFKLFSARSTPHLNLADVIAHAATPKTFSGRKFVERSTEYQNISDFDFAPAEVKKAFYQKINQQHAGQRIVYFNLSKSGQRSNWEYVNVKQLYNVSISRLRDLFLVFLNLPNGSYNKILTNVAK